ncbi:MAG: isoprenylcysteine carboxylmethyltransferase family protein [Vulcanimicrobiaceae bacterium]
MADRPGVLVPPPLIFAVALGCGLAIDRDPHARAPHAHAYRRLGVAAIVGGAALGAGTLGWLKRAGTNPSPYAPTTALVTDGPFTWTRNPAYVGATSVYIGIALYAYSLPALTLLPVALAVLDRAVVEREERYLDGLFGEAYRAYRARVPRWF